MTAQDQNTETSSTATENSNASAPGAFQRPQAPQPPSRPAAFGSGYGNFSANNAPGNFAPNSSAAAPSSSTSTPSTPATGAYTTSYGVQSGRRLVIGEGITMSGEIEACENLVVEGTVDASLKGARNLEITQNGTFFGSVEIDEATIAGRFEGDLKVNGRLTIRSSGSIIGSIQYKELAIEPGAMIEGRLQPLTTLTSAQEAGKRSGSAPTGKGRVAAASFKQNNDKENESLFGGRRAPAAE